MLVVPLSFVSDHIETLYEVDMLFADVAREAGIVHYGRTEALNTSSLFVGALAGLVNDHLAPPEASSCVNCGSCDCATPEPLVAVGGPA